ncbi:Zn-ribbon domain-containing OB-fold protein [Orrella sp. 11846]|uniref:Zn-ribbon domain-containing OB-fold protein n=1 Tax=Orrella sp. 11846 TaxID=3409913 RepID=UPI003B597A94
MQTDTELKIAHCSKCKTYTLPANAYGCRACGAESNLLEAVDLPMSPKLVNFVTLHVALSPELDAPCVIGEIELAPGVIEEAVIDVADEVELKIGMTVSPLLSTTKTGKPLWKFVPNTASGEAA